MRFLIYFLFCLSGAVALVYESLWSRYLKLFLGHSSYGQIVTLIVFMGGLGLGSFLAARYLKRVQKPFLMYARVELLAAVCGFGFHLAYQSLTGWFFDHAAQLQGVSPWLANATQIGLCLLLTLPFATLLGTTFPLLAAGMIRNYPDGGRDSLPTLYFTNSLGGAAGILLTSYWLVSRFGTDGALHMAALGNAVVAAGFYAIHRSLTSRKPVGEVNAAKLDVATPPQSDVAAPNDPSRPRVALWLFVAAGTGFASFVYEVGWIRLLSLILGSSTHSFDAMISAFILGLAFGGLFARRLIRRFTGDLAPVLGTIQVLMGCFALLGILLYRPFFDAVNASHGVLAKTQAAYPIYSAFKYLLCLALMFPAAFCAGMTLPLITWRLLRDTGRDAFTGLVYGWNTIGSIAGAALAGLVFMPLLQLKWTIFTGAAIDISLGVLLLAATGLPAAAPARRSALALRFAAAAVIAAAVLPAIATQFDSAVLASGKFRHLAFTASPPKVIEIRHGKTATISVGRAGKNLFVATNGKSDGAITDPEQMQPLKKSGDEGTVAQLAILPMLTRSADYDAAVIGMGTGMTGHYLLADEKLRRLDLIEIEEAVIDLARHFRPRNERLWHDDRLHVIVDDAKRHFYANRGQYDIIVSEPSNPWVSGVSGLFTKEFYQHIRHFLKPGGVLVQWVHGYEFRDDLLISIFSALDTFEHFEIYRVHENAGDFIVIAGDDPFAFVDTADLAARSKIDEDLAPLGRNIEQFGPSNFIASSKSLRPILDEFRHLANSDYYPYVEQNAETAFFTRDQVQMPSAMTFAFAGYPDLFEPKRIAAARALRPRTGADIAAEQQTTHYRQTRDLLVQPSPDTDWDHLEKLLLTATEYTAGTPLWPDQPLVVQMRQAVERKLVSEPVALRFRLLDAIAKQDDETIKTVILPAIKAAGPDVLKEPFWIRTFLVQGIRLNLKEPVGEIVVQGVDKNPRIGADERILINHIVNTVINFDPTQVASRPGGEDER